MRVVKKSGSGESLRERGSDAERRAARHGVSGGGSSNYVAEKAKGGGARRGEMGRGAGRASKGLGKGLGLTGNWEYVGFRGWMRRRERERRERNGRRIRGMISKPREVWSGDEAVLNRGVGREWY